jgi:hypothetical protein
MSDHRFREHLQRVSSVDPVMTVGASAFVPCPMFVAFPVAQQAHILAIYQLAAQKTLERQSPCRRSRMADFSVN